MVISTIIPLSTAGAATLTVNSTDDQSDVSPGNGVCATGAGACTLRAAIQEANASPGADTIVLPAGVYALQIPTVNEDLDTTGDFDIHSPMTIAGAGAASTIIDGGFPLPGADPTARGLDRLFEIHPTAGNVTLQNLTLREGYSIDNGGAIQHWSSGLLRLENVHVRDSYAGGAGGGLNNADPVDYEWAVQPLVPPKSGRVEIVNSTFSGNAAGSYGAAVNNTSNGTVSILAGSQVVDNPGEMIPDPAQVIDPLDPEPIQYIPGPGVYQPSAGAIANEGATDSVGTIKIADSTVSGNYATSNGAGVLNDGSGILVVENSTFLDNYSEAGGGGLYATGGTATVNGSTFSGNEAADGGGLYSKGAVNTIGLRPKFTLTDSTVSGNHAYASGGGMYNGGDAELALSNVTFSGNSAWDAGGGLRTADRSSAALTRVTFSDNYANGEGGGAWIGSERPVTIADSVFNGNDAGVPTPGDLANPLGANIAGGGGLYTENGQVTITGSTFDGNTATDEGGGLSLDNFGDVVIRDSILRNNRAGTDGGGMENSGFRVTFERLLVTGNRAELLGGGIFNSSSGVFTILDTTVSLNSAVSGGGLANAPDNDLIVRRSLFLRNTARNPGLQPDGDVEDGGKGGGVYSQADGDSLIENTTISGNTAYAGGGGLFHDADGKLKLDHVTIWRNSAPRGGGVGVVESDFVPPIPPKANVAVIARNSIIGGSLQGGSCDWYITSEGGNVDGMGTQNALPIVGEGTVLPVDTYCFLYAAPTSDISFPATHDRRSSSMTLDAIADNGGPTLTHALQYGNVAIDNGVLPCPQTDQRGVTRPQNTYCDAGAYEFVGDPPPFDDMPPETEFGAVLAEQDSLETMALHFTGSDNLTSQADLSFQCRFYEMSLLEQPDPIAPWDPIPVELWWVNCSSPWQVPLIEAEIGGYIFEVRAVDRAYNIDPTPAVHVFNANTTPPETIIIEKPPLVTNNRSATFSFSIIDGFTPPQFAEYECRLDSRDPEMWLECFNPTFYSNLASGEHTLEVRAYNGAEIVDPTPARYTWTVAQGDSCDLANITLTATADGWVDEVNPVENYLFETELTVRSGAIGDPTAVPPEPVVGQNARSLFRFALPTDASNCALESATLRLYNASPTEGRTLEAVPLAGSWSESTLTWMNQPGVLSGAVPATAASREGYQEWDVLAHVQAMLESGVSYGWQIRDATENDFEGGDQSFLSREMPQDPPEMTLPQLVLRYAADGAPPPPPPDPVTDETTVTCGQVLTQSTTLANDLVGCMGEGLIIGAPNIVVDLNGHSITSGLLLPAGQEGGGYPGIRNGGHTNVVIRNGTVSGFDYGVVLGAGTTHNVVENLTLTGNTLAGVYLFDADNGRTGNTIRGNHFNHNVETGLRIESESEKSLIENNTFIGNGMSIYLLASNGHTIQNNEISGVLLNPLLDSDAGIVMENSSRNVLLDNDISDTGDAGVIIHMGSHNNRVEGGVMTRNGDAGVVIADSDGNQVIGILAHQQSDGGVVLNNAHNTVVRDSDLRFNPSGVDASNANNLLVENNDASDALQAGFGLGSGLNMRILNNVANRTGGAGISMEGAEFDALGNPVGGALIEGNTTNENGQDGITVADGGHTIKNNTAYNNFGFGIRAGEALEPGAPPDPAANIDGGGNVAAGNAEPEQCVGVVCTPGEAPPASTLDTTAPETTIISGPNTPTANMNAVFTFTGTDNATPLTGMVFECRIDPLPDVIEVEPPDVEPPDPGQPPEPPEPVEGEGWVECISPLYLNGLEQGPHHFEVRARDQADNFDLTPATYDWEIDITVVDEGTGPDSVAPDTRIISSPSNPTTSTSAAFGFAGTDNATPGLSLNFECSLDGAGFAACTSPVTFEDLGVGEHTFEVRAIDRATVPNTDPTPATYTWEILTAPADSTPPDTTVDAGPDPITALNEATFTFSSNEPAATFECSLDGGATWSACASPKTYSGLAAGELEFRVRAVDLAGNYDPTPAAWTWTISYAPIPTTVYCGQVIAQSIVVRNDLYDCLWDGLVVGADGITIDLDGHTIDGKGIAAGIRNDGYDNVSIKNGMVVEFDYGVMLNPGVEGNIIEGMTLQNNQEAGVALGVVPHPLDPTLPFPLPPPPTYQAGVRDNILRNNIFLADDVSIWLTNGTRNTLIRNNDIAASGSQGIWLERSSLNRVENNLINASGGTGLELEGSSNNVIVGNTLTENSPGLVLITTNSAAGYMPSNDNLIQSNIITESGGPGIEIAGSSNSAISGNQVLDNVATYSNGEGIRLYYANETLVRGNNVHANTGGIVLQNAGNNRIEANDASQSNGDGISVGALSLSNQVVGNISSYNNGAGISVTDEVASTSGTLIEGNTTSNNTSYGIQVSKPSHVIKDNTANENGTWGIYASDPSNGRANVDGGGNRAQDNLGPIDPITLQPMNCYFIRCDGGDVPPDLIPPDTLILQGPPNPSASTTATFYFNGNDNVGHVAYECRIDAGVFTACASPATYTGLAAGAHTFAVRAVDISGNVDATPATLTWTIDFSGPPETTITSGPDLTTMDTSATFEFSSSEAGSTFECALDGAAFAGCASLQTYTGLVAGPHTFQVRATDGDGNTDATPATQTWTVGDAPVPTVVGCGQIITRSTLVLNDLIDCGGFGLIVGANNITIDLNNHLIDGVNLDAGILNNGYDGVTIVNGTITQFYYGVQLNPGTSNNIIANLRVEANSEAGILLSDADQNGRGNTLRDNTLSANGVGIWLASNTRYTQVRDNLVSGNGAQGLLLEFASENRIEANEISRSGGYGILMLGGGDNALVGNILANNNGYHIGVGEELLPSDNNLIEGNTIHEGPGGIIVADSSGTQILFNNVIGTTGPGLSLDLATNTLVRGNDLSSNASGIDLSEATNNRIESNNASGMLGAGIAIDALSYNNTVVNNLASENNGEGIELEGSALDGQTNLIQGNIADGNGGDGIGVYGVGQTLTNNSAQRNGGWGIYAAVGAIDGGGNFAAGNMEPAQCFGIACTIGLVPGAPETWIVSGPTDVDPGTPGIQSNSRNASFTYMGSDVESLLTELVFECRLDTTNDLAWEDCEYPAEFLNLNPGEHTLEIRAIDMLGAGLADPTPARFTWTYVPLPSGVAPEVILDFVPENPSTLYEAGFTFHSNEPDVTFECKVDLFGYEPCGFEGATYMSQGAFEWAFEETEAGLHTFYVRGIDFEGNVGEPTTYTWSIIGVVTTFTAGPGFTPGETPLDPPTGGEVYETTATLDFIANVADATYECSLDLAPFTPCTPPVTYIGLLAGEHELRVIATDLATGVSEEEGAIYEWSIVEFIDANPPETTIERAPANNSSATVFEFTGTDDLTPPAMLTFECRMDSTNDLDWFECVSPFNLLDLFTYEEVQMAPGQHTFEVRAIDAAEPLDPNSLLEGNPDPTPASYTWTMVADTTPPGTGILSGPPATVGVGQEILFEFFGTDNATPVLALTFECAVDVGPFEPCTSPESVQGLEAGEHTFSVRAVDLAGNADPTPAPRTFTVMAAPITTITSGPAGQIIDGIPPASPGTTESATFVFSADQAGSTFECSLDGADYVLCASPHAAWVVESGSHMFEVRATNPAGVVEDLAAVYEWMVDLALDSTPPNTTITSAPANPDTSTVATFSFTGSDNRTLAAGLTFECALDGGSAPAYNSCVAPQQFSDLTHGSHTLLVRARDAAGNFDPTPASYTWSVELPPVTTILSGPADVTEAITATFTFEANLPGSTYTCWLDGLMEGCASPKTYTGLAGGEHLFAVLATGPAGSLEQAWVEWEWTIADTTPPITTIESGPDVQTESISATFVFSANEPDVTFLCSLDGSEPQACVSPQEYPFLYPGLHRFEVTAYSPIMLDPFGQPIEPLYDPIPTVYAWTIIDAASPETTITYGPAATTASPNAYFGFASEDPLAIFECSLNGAGFSGCDPMTVYENLLPGAHTLLARAVDMAGNADPTPAEYAWTIAEAVVNTPAGTNVVVELPLPTGGSATLTFLEVTLPGATTLDLLNGAPPLPAGYSLAGGQFYDINTTAEYTEPVTLCIPYDPDSFSGTAVRLLHFDGSAWIDVTTMSDPAGLVCGQPEGFSPFALASGSGLAPLASIISGPPNPSSSGIATFTFWADQPGAMILCSIDGLPFTACTSPVTYYFLEAGDHDFQVQAVGADGQIQLVPTLYEWEVSLQTDTTPPDTTITAGAPNLTVNWINWFQFTGVDDQTAPLELDFQCWLDGVDLGGCSSPEDITVVAAGGHTFEVSAIDDAGNIDPTPASWTWTVVDMSAPDTSIELGPDSETELTSATFEFVGEVDLTGEPVFDFECSLDNAEFTACTSPHEITGLAAGPHVFQVRALNPAGVADPTPDFYEWLILLPPDTTPPDTFIVAGPPPDNSGPDVIFGFASNEPAEFECSLDGSPYESCEAVYELLGLAQGQHTLLVRALDLAEIPNVDPTPASYTWTTLGEPDTLILSGPADPSGSFSATFTFTSTQAGATFQCSVDGSPYAPCTSPFIAGPLVEEGEHEFEVRAVNQFTYLDGSQVVDLTPATYTWTIQDVTPPDTTIVSVTYLPPTDLVEPNSFRFEFAGEDNRTAAFELSFECSLDGGPFEGCEAIYYLPLEGLPGGAHELQVRAVDDIGNVDPSPASYAWTTEGEPETTILTGPDAQTESTEATFTFSSDQPGATFECALDGAVEFTPCPSPVTFTDVPYGAHELLVRARSPMGTAVDLTPAEYAWESGDMTPPVVTIASGPAITTTSTTATFTFSADDPEALFQCSLDGAPLAFCTSPVTYTGLLAGDHTFEVGATKPNLLVEGVAAVWDWTVLDDTAPETTIVSGPPAEIGLGTPAVFVFSSNELDATFECSLNGEPFAECATPPDHTAEFNEPAGSYTLLVRAVDLSLNVDATPPTYTWTVVGPPLTTILSSPAVTTTETTATFTFSADQAGATFACALDGADFTPCTSSVVYPDLAAGSHLFEVLATNQFGVAELAPVSYEWTVVDGTAPETSIDLAPPATTANTTATFAFSSNELDAGFECRLDTTDPLAFAGCSSPQTYAGLSVGSHTFEVRAVDAAGNIDATPASYSWMVEAPAPPNTLIGTNVTVTVGDATLTFTSVTADGLTTVEPLSSAPALPDGYLQAGALYYDINTTAGYTGTVTVCLNYIPGSVADPVRLLHFDGGSAQAWVDVTTTNDPLAGLVCGEPGSLSPFAIATGTAAVVPDTTIEAGPPAVTASTSADFAFSSNDPAATFECALDDLLDWGSCQATTTFEGLAVGQHNLLVRARNAAGLFDATPASYVWTITPLPETFIGTAPADPTESTTATFVFSSDQPGATFECALDDAAVFIACESGITYSFLALGEHTFLVRARDADGNVDPTPAEHEWEIGDIPAPVVIASGPDAITESTTATFVFSADETNPTYECALDSAAFAPCTSPKTYNGLAFGNHMFQVRILNPAAVSEPPITIYEWSIVDLGLPDTVIDSGPLAVTDSPEATFNFHATEANATFECSLNSAPFAPCSSPAGYSGLLPGEYLFEVRAIDSMGNIDPSPASHAWTVVSPPETAILSGPDSVINVRSATFTFSSDQAGSTFECSLDQGPFGDCTSPHTVNDLPDGDHQFEVRARNTYGIADSEPALHEWMVEAGPPETTIVTGPANPTTATTASFTFSANEAGALFECALDGAAFIECLSPYGFADLAIGEHTFLVRATDGAGNVDPTPASYTWTVEGPPETTINAIASGSVIISFMGASQTAPQSQLTFECRLDNQEFAACTSPVTYSDPAGGSHIFEVRAVDADGNADPTPARFTWTGNPSDCSMTGTLSSMSDAWIDQNSSSNNFGSDAILKVRSQGPADNFRTLLQFPLPSVPATCVIQSATLRLYAASWTNDRTLEALRVAGAWTESAVTWDNQPGTSGPAATTMSGPGYREWDVTSLVQAEYGAGNNSGFLVRDAVEDGGGPEQQFHGREKDESIPELVITFAPAPVQDTTPPETTIDSGPSNPTTDTAALFSFSADEPGATFECALDGGTLATCASPVELTGLEIGAHTFEVRATDAAGNTDPTPASYAWTVEAPADTTPPETTIDSGPSNPTTDTAALFTFSADELGVTFECDLDGTGFIACPSPHEITSLGIGSHTFEVRATDPAGNTDPTPASYAWTVEAPADTTPPETTIDSGPTSPTTDTTALLTFSSDDPGATFECALDGGTLDACASPVELTGLAVGAHTFEARATDVAGNTDATPASYAWTVEALPDCTASFTLPSDADAWIDQNSSSNNMGADSILKVQSKGPSDNFRALVRFGLPALPQGCVVQSATLRLYSPSATNGRTLQALQMTGDWTENGVTWSNLPGTTGAGATTASGTGYREWDVAALVQAMYDTGANHGFLIRDAAENGSGFEQQLHSREKGESMPELVIAFAPAPPPDTTAPETTIDSGPAGTTTDTSATFTFSADEPGATFECALDGSVYAACASPHAATDLAVGSHTFEVRATDQAGNVDDTPASHTWTVEAPPADTTPPETTFDSGPANPTADTSATFTFSADESGATFECALDGSAYTACPSPHAVTDLAVGPHTFEVRATDPAGNTDPTPASYAWTVEAPPAPVDCSPSITLSAAADSWIDQGSSSSNKGSDSILKVQAKSGSNNRLLVRFELPALPQGCVVQSAALRLYSPSWRTGRTLRALRITGAWTENGVTWSNQPATNGTAATTSSGSGYREWNVAAQVQAMFDTGANHGFLIRDASEGGGGSEQQFHSREKGESMPELVITFAPAIAGTTTVTTATMAFPAGGPDRVFGWLLGGAAFGANLSPVEFMGWAVVAASLAFALWNLAAMATWIRPAIPVWFSRRDYLIG
jgi:CSLREA domain-containing protein